MHHIGLCERGNDSNYSEYISLAIQIYISSVGSRLLLTWEAGTGESWPGLEQGLNGWRDLFILKGYSIYIV